MVQYVGSLADTSDTPKLNEEAVCAPDEWLSAAGGLAHGVLHVLPLASSKCGQFSRQKVGFVLDVRRIDRNRLNGDSADELMLLAVLDDAESFAVNVALADVEGAGNIDVCFVKRDRSSTGFLL